MTTQKTPKKYTPDNIHHLEPNEVFVFGDNERARHGAGAALYAVRKFGAKDGQHGLVGQAYGISTKDASIQTLPLSKIQKHIDRFHVFASSRPDLTFYVTQIGCGLAGFSPKDIGPLFQTLSWPDNVIMPKAFNVY